MTVTRIRQAADPRAIRHVTMLMVVLILTACGGPGPAPDRSPAVSDDAAEAAYQQGRYAQAADAFEQAAGRQPGRAAYWLLRAADAAWQADQRARAAELLTRLDPAQLDPQQRALWQLLRAAAGARDLPVQRLLANLDFPASRLPPDYQPLFHRLRAAAFLAAGRPYASALERIALETYLLGPKAIADNHRQILEALQRLSPEQARRLSRLHADDPVVRGWLELVALLKEALFTGQSAQEALATWRRRYPSHSANSRTAESLLAAYDQRFTPPQRIALLLPFSGPLASAGRALQDGFLAAHFSTEDAGEIRVYDTGNNPHTALAAYRQALTEGVAYIVGPLDKDAATAVVLEADGAVPVLALNYSGTEAPPAENVYQFGLLPDDDAAAAAERMLRDGHSRAVVMRPDSRWGERLTAAFIERFQSLGGEVLDTASYPEEGAGDFGNLIERLLGMEESKTRRNQLRAHLGVPLAVVPQRRHDVDALFMAARPREGRMIKPQLAFNNAGSLPVYATAQVYSGSDVPVADQDLNSVRFCDAPWLLGSQSFELPLKEAREIFPSTSGSGSRLFALGMDAYRVLPFLSWLSRFGSRDRFPGASGQLQVGEQGVIHRSLDCAEFERGQPQYLEPRPRMETPAP